jgi:hypothetical protein
MRLPNNAVPTLTMVEPSDIATSKSSVMPIESSVKLANFACELKILSLKFLKKAKQVLESSGLPVFLPMVIKPL